MTENTMEPRTIFHRKSQNRSSLQSRPDHHGWQYFSRFETILYPEDFDALAPEVFRRRLRTISKFRRRGNIIFLLHEFCIWVNLFNEFRFYKILGCHSQIWLCVASRRLQLVSSKSCSLVYFQDYSSLVKFSEWCLPTAWTSEDVKQTYRPYQFSILYLSDAVMIVIAVHCRLPALSPSNELTRRSASHMAGPNWSRVWFFLIFAGWCSTVECSTSSANTSLISLSIQLIYWVMLIHFIPSRMLTHFEF